jgi:hypothetical protein
MSRLLKLGALPSFQDARELFCTPYKMEENKHSRFAKNKLKNYGDLQPASTANINKMHRGKDSSELHIKTNSLTKTVNKKKRAKDKS